MKKFSELRNAATNRNDIRILAEKDFDVYRDGGSHGHKILNREECGFDMLYQNFSIHSEKNGTRSKWYAAHAPPNHTARIEVPNEKFSFELI